MIDVYVCMYVHFLSRDMMYYASLMLSYLSLYGDLSE